MDTDLDEGRDPITDHDVAEVGALDAGGTRRHLVQEDRRRGPQDGRDREPTAEASAQPAVDERVQQIVMVVRQARLEERWATCAQVDLGDPVQRITLGDKKGSSVVVRPLEHERVDEPTCHGSTCAGGKHDLGHLARSHALLADVGGRPICGQCETDRPAQPTGHLPDAAGTNIHGKQTPGSSELHDVGHTIPVQRDLVGRLQAGGHHPSSGVVGVIERYLQERTDRRRHQRPLATRDLDVLQVGVPRADGVDLPARRSTNCPENSGCSTVAGPVVRRPDAASKLVCELVSCDGHSGYPSVS